MPHHSHSVLVENLGSIDVGLHPQRFDTIQAARDKVASNLSEAHHDDCDGNCDSGKIIEDIKSGAMTRLVLDDMAISVHECDEPDEEHCQGFFMRNHLVDIVREWARQNPLRALTSTLGMLSAQRQDEGPHPETGMYI